MASARVAAGRRPGGRLGELRQGVARLRAAADELPGHALRTAQVRARLCSAHACALSAVGHRPRAGVRGPEGTTQTWGHENQYSAHVCAGALRHAAPRSMGHHRRDLVGDYGECNYRCARATHDTRQPRAHHNYAVAIFTMRGECPRPRAVAAVAPGAAPAAVQLNQLGCVS